MGAGFGKNVNRVAQAGQVVCVRLMFGLGKTEQNVRPGMIIGCFIQYLRQNE